MPPRRPRDDDTIVVKGDDQEWEAPSSPDSIGSDIDFEPKKKMATNSPPQDLESPSPEPEKSKEASSMPATLNPNLPSSSRPKYLNQISFRDPGSSTMEERLQMMPAKRTLPWRDGIEAGSEVETGGDSRRKQIRFGCLLATRGNVVTDPCASCAAERGKFALCIALPGFFKGACASCQLSGRPNRCSIKTLDDIEPEEFTASDGIRSSPVAEDEDTGVALKYSGPGSRRNTAKDTPDRSSSVHAQETMPSGPPAKRARVEEPAKLPRTGWQEPPVVDTGLGSGKVRLGRPPRSSLNANPWAHVNSPHMATRNSSTPNTRNGGLRRSVGRPASEKGTSAKETSVKETSRKSSNTPSTETPQSVPSRPSSTGWAPVNQIPQGSQTTFPNLSRQIPPPKHQTATPEQQKAKPGYQPLNMPQQAPQAQAQAKQQQEAQAKQQEAQAKQQQLQAKQQAEAKQQQIQAEQQQAQQQQSQQQQVQHQHYQNYPQPHQSHVHQSPYPPLPSQQPPVHQAPPQQNRTQPQFQGQLNIPPPPTTAFGGFVDQQNGRMGNGSTTPQPATKGKPYQPNFSYSTGLASAPLIDTLPKRKQMQLMGVISGIQGGIDNIQRELNQLKKTLGVDDE